ncbi:MAG TPA: PQQ-binding-like beta-propeller repeat protein [Pirellulales bacterium]|nr:PQQ-binding-like beta-propeller repeat protein [Pirellulales bacterium]
MATPAFSWMLAFAMVVVCSGAPPAEQTADSSRAPAPAATSFNDGGRTAAKSPASVVPAAPPTKAAGSDWSCFRGPRCGVSSWNNAPLDWDGSTARGVVWKTPLATSCTSSPVVWRNHIYITEANHDERAVVAFDTENGRQLWRQVVPDGGGGEALPSVADSALALPTPACDADGVCALFGTGDLACFSHDGKLRWKNFLQRPVIGYGHASSPAIWNKMVFIQLDWQENGKVLCLDGTSGKTIWERQRSRGASWSSPIVIPEADGSPIWVANANGSITGFDKKGQVVWDLDGVTGQVAPSPTWADNRLYLLNVGSSLMCYGGATNPKLLWQYKKGLSETSSPLVTHGLLFMAVTPGSLVCLDATTGEQQWKQRAPGAYASLVGSGDRVYCMGRDGTTLVVAAERTFRQIALCELSDGADATPAMADGRMFIRSNHFLWCLGTKKLQ